MRTFSFTTAYKYNPDLTWFDYWRIFLLFYLITFEFAIKPTTRYADNVGRHFGDRQCRHPWHMSADNVGSCVAGEVLARRCGRWCMHWHVWVETERESEWVKPAEVIDLVITQLWTNFSFLNSLGRQLHVFRNFFFILDLSETRRFWRFFSGTVVFYKSKQHRVVEIRT